MKRFLIALALVALGSWGDGPVDAQANQQNCNTTCYNGNCATQCY
jgi:hypothetical protein